jgi:protease YdgD
MKKLFRLLAIFGLGVLMAVSLGYWATVQAQSTLTETGARQFCRDLDNPIPINLPFNSATDAATNPGGRQISHRPCDDTQAIVGDDVRLPVLNRSFPWSAIGRLEWQVELPVQSTCTATLIGEDLLVTNAHCLQRPTEIDEITERILSEFTDLQTYEAGVDKLIFKPSLIRGSSPASATVISYEYGSNDPERDVSDDWALLRIDQPLGRTYGYLGWRLLDYGDQNVIDSLANQIILAGYSADYPTEPQRTFGDRSQTAGVHTQCAIEGESEELGYEILPEFPLPDGEVLRYSIAKFNSETPTPGLLVHNCDTTGGSSGSSILALFEDGYSVIGIHAGWNPVIPDSIPAGSSREECATVGYDQQRNPVYRNVGICRNRGVQASRWAAQARAMRGER